MWYKLCVWIKITRCGKNKWEACDVEVTQAASSLKRPLDGQYYCLELILRHTFLSRRLKNIMNYFILPLGKDEKTC